MLKLTFHELSAFSWCRLRWAYAYIAKLRPLEEKPQLTLGTAVHKALSVFYSKPFTNRSLDLLLSAIPTDRSIPGKVEDILKSFYTKFGNDEMVQGQPEGEWSYAVLKKDYMLTVHPDLVSLIPTTLLSGVKLSLFEHKTGQNPDLEYYLMFDTQKWFYACVLSKAMGAIKVDFTYTILSTISPFRVERVTFPMPNHLMQLRYDEFVHTADAIYEWRKEGYDVHPHYNLTCPWSCPFFPICRARLSGGDERFVIESQFTQMVPQAPEQALDSSLE